MLINILKFRRNAMFVVTSVMLTVGSISLPSQAQAAESIKIGVLATLTGGVADINASEINGLKVRLKQMGYQSGGNKIEIFVEDDGGDPNTGVTKMQKLVERDKVDVVIGPFLGHIIAATQDYVGKKRSSHATPCRTDSRKRKVSEYPGAKLEHSSAWTHDG